MSLIHWWPLNGDLKDKIGNNHLKYSNTVTTVLIENESGKMGKCYERTESNTVTDALRSTNKIKALTTQSICAWVYFIEANSIDFNTANGLVTNHNHATNSGLGIGVFTSDGENCYISVNAGTGSSRIHSSPSYRGKTNIKNAWHHVCMTYSTDKKIRLYVDGKEDMDARAYDLKSPSDYFDVFNWSVGHIGVNRYRPKCRICDVRVYDHALSQLEVKELSKALSVCYSFDDILIEKTTNLLSGKEIYFSGLTLKLSYQKNNNIYTLTSSTYEDGYSYGTIRLKVPYTVLTNGTTYYLSYKYKIISEGEGEFIPSDWCDSTILEKTDVDCGDYRLVTVKCYTTRDYNSTYCFLDLTMSMNTQVQIWNIQLQSNLLPTPYTKGTRLSCLYNEAEQVQPDMIETHNTFLTLDSAIGQYSLRCNNTAIVTPLVADINQGVTVSCWVKTPEYPPKDQNEVVFADSNSKLAFGFFNETEAIISCANYGVEKIVNLKEKWVGKDNTRETEWHHIVVTRNIEGKVSCWLDGEELTERGSSNHWSQNKEALIIGCRYNGSYGPYCSCYIDDFRVYQTLLSEDDIVDLYKTKGYISKQGDIMCNEFIENCEVAQVTKNGTFEANEMYEELYTDYEQLEFVQSSGAQYVDTGYVATTNHTVYELDFENVTTSNFDSLIGFMKPSDLVPRIGLHNYQGKLMFGANTTVNSIATTSGERMLLKGDFKSGAQKLYKNDTLIASSAQSFDHSANTLSTYIFARNCAGSLNYAKIKLYGAKIYEGDSIVRDYVPVRRKSDQAVGLYDLVNDEFVASGTSTTLVAGTSLTTRYASIYPTQNISARELIEI